MNPRSDSWHSSACLCWQQHRDGGRLRLRSVGYTCVSDALTVTPVIFGVPCLQLKADLVDCGRVCREESMLKRVGLCEVM